MTRALAVAVFLAGACGVTRFTAHWQSAVWLLAVVGCLAFIYLVDTPAQLLHGLERKRDLRVIRERLGQFGLEGTPLRDVALASSDPTTARQRMSAWTARVAAYLDRELGQDYVFRFTSGVGGASFVPPDNLKFGTTQFLRDIHGHLSALNEFIKELQ